MFKHIIQQLVVFTLLFITSKYIHLYILNDAPSFPLSAMYLYHYLFAMGICMLFVYLNDTDMFENQLGFIYLGTLLLKILFFVILFKTVVLGDVLLPRIDRLSMLVPLFLFLFLEVFYMSKILQDNSTTRIK